ncbi:Uncharacterised protein [Bordetella pertussis]|nr:Uncharacterised protein [Bordetella pertussis]
MPGQSAHGSTPWYVPCQSSELREVCVSGGGAPSGVSEGAFALQADSRAASANTGSRVFKMRSFLLINANHSWRCGWRGNRILTAHASPAQSAGIHAAG